MTITHNVPKTLWYKAINYATYVHNKSFTCAIKGKTPEESFTAQKPDISHLQEFSCIVWVLNETCQSKLDPKSHKMMMFVGFVDESHAIKYYNTHTKNVGTTQNYHFVNYPPDIQFEGEDEPQEPMGEQIESVRNCETLKHKHPNDKNPPVFERNLRP